jgi:hypothetical protein
MGAAMRTLMNALFGLLRKIAALFFDDGNLALAILAVLAVTAILLHTALAGTGAGLAFLVGGVVAVLLENVLRTARRSRQAD